MIVDWQPEQRGDLEVGMHDGLVVVGYDDRGFRLLKDCHVNGTYGFMGMTRREKVVRLESADDIKANLPLGGLGIAAKLGGELEKGATLDIAMVMIGKLRTTWRNVGQEDLVGQCAGATHVIRGATVGAFAVDRGDRMRARAVAEIFGAGGGGGTASSSMTRVVDGQLTDCASATPDSPTAPKQCGALIRVELLPIDTAKKDKKDTKDAAKSDVELRDVCPAGLVMIEGKCTTPKANAPAQVVECPNGNARACLEACKANNAKSCSKLALMTIRGDGGAPKAPEQGAQLAERACMNGDPAGCTLLGGLLQEGIGLPKNPTKAAQAYAKGCDDGDADGCMYVGTLLLTGSSAVQRDTKLAAKALMKGCKGGADGACSDLGLLALGGQGFDKDLPFAVEMFKKACDGDNSTGCANYAYMQEFGQGITKNVDQAVRNYAKACKLNDASCTWLAAMLQLGKGVQRDESKAVGLYKLGCNAGDVISCAIIRGYLDPSQAVNVDHFQAYINVWKDTCQAGTPRDCSGLGVLAVVAGKKDEGKQLLARGCSLGDEWGCLMSKMQPK